MWIANCPTLGLLGLREHYWKLNCAITYGAVKKPKSTRIFIRAELKRFNEELDYRNGGELLPSGD